MVICEEFYIKPPPALLVTKRNIKEPTGDIFITMDAGAKKMPALMV